MSGSTQISWFVWGNDIKWTNLYFSKDGGRIWSALSSSSISTQPGWNYYTANLTEVTSKGRVAIQCSSSSFDLIAADGSRKNFFVQQKPDLIALPGPTGFCQLDGQGKLKVIIKNQGTTSASSSVTKVEFFYDGVTSTEMLTTSALGAGAQTELTVDFPGLCWNPDCDFRITIDSNKQVNEANEGNNVESGACVS